MIWTCSSFLLVFVLSYYKCVFAFRVPCCDVCYDFSIKTMSVCLYLQLFVVGLMSYLRQLCSFEQSGVQHILCRVFCFVLLRLVYPMLLVSLDCPFVIVLRYYLTFIEVNVNTTIIHELSLISLSILLRLQCVTY
jgi:hypothetical protein